MRKVLSFVLVLTLVLSSFSMAFAGTEAQTSLSDIAGNVNEEAITVDFNLGIIDGMGDGTFAPDQDVNRAQFAAMITRALAIPDSALAGYTATTFKDTSGYGWAVPYLAYCQSKGILVGDGNGNVMPGRTVSVNEAMTMVMRAVGYTNNSAALVGVWPANYVTLAQNNDLYDDVAVTVNVNRANAAQIIYNALMVDKVEVASDGTTTVLSDRTNNDESKWKLVNMLTTGLNCYSEVRTIDGDEDTLINLKPYVGQTVTAFFNDDDEIVAIYSIESDTVSGEFEKSAKLYVSGTSIYLTAAAIGNGFDYTLEGDDDVDYTVKDDQVYQAFLLNGESQTLAKTDGYDLTEDTTVTINGDISGKNINTIDTITTWVENTAKKVKAADANSIEDDSLLGSDFTTLKDGSIDETSFELIGIDSLDDIAADNVVAVYEKGMDGDIVRVEVGTKIIEGKVKSTKDGGEKLVIDGTTYEKSDYRNAKDITKNKVESGDTVKLYLDAYGDVFDYDVTSGSNDKYAVLMDSNTQFDQVKLYTADDDSAWYDYTSDVDEDDFATESAVAYRDSDFFLAAYGLNSKGKVDTITTDELTTGGIDIVTSSTVSGLTLKVPGDSFKIDSDCAVYGIDYNATDPDESDVDSYTKIGDVEKGEDLGYTVYMLDEDGVVVALMVDMDMTSAGDDDNYAVVSEVNSTENDDEDSVQQVIGYVNGDSLDKLTTEDDTADDIDTDYVGVWKLKFDSDGNVSDITDANDEVADGLDNVSTEAYGYVVYDTDDNNIQVTSGGVLSDWLPVADDAHVYRAVLDDGDVDYYKVSDVNSINTGYRAWFYNTIDDDDSDGYDVVVFVTKSDAEDWN